MLPFTTIAVERAAGDLRRGMPVILEIDAGTALLVIATEELSPEGLHFLQDTPTPSLKLLLAEGRTHHLFNQQAVSAIPLEKLGDTPETIITNANILCGTNAGAVPNITPITASHHDHIALQLVKIAELLPSAIVTDIKVQNIRAWGEETRLVSVTENDITAYKDTIAVTLKKACEAPLILKGAKQTRIISYRPAIGGAEHYAIIIGTPEKDKAPLVRIHSSCYTGDLLGSLTCDCGDQLQSAIHLMGDKAAHPTQNDSGGIILYLMQEGRGIGLTNKLRTYSLQAEGYDTVDANKVLGFDDDERLFQPAVAILHSLGISTVRLLSNNPKKAKGLEELGIHVEACVPHIMPTHEHNDSYLKTKAERLGHKLDKGKDSQ